jgi:hypothetical protein
MMWTDGTRTPLRLRIKLVPLALCVIVGSLVAAPGATYGRAQTIALSGTQTASVSVANANFQSAGPWTIITNGQLTGTFAFTGEGATLAGSFTRVVNVKVDAGNNGILWGTVRYVDTSTGVTCTGVNQGTLTNNYLTGKLVASCSDGSLLRGTLQDTKLTYDELDHLITVETYFTGTLLNANG